MLMNLSSMKYIKVRKHQNNDFKRCQDFEDTGKIRCLCQNGSRHKNTNNYQCLNTCLFSPFPQGREKIDS